MILNVSGRTDIVAFYSKWFLNRLKEGYVCVRNPFNPNLVSKINFKDVDLILFCTKNPIPILNNLDDIKIPFLFHITITPYKQDVEPNVPNKRSVIEAVKKISEKIGAENVYIRYDPIFISKKYNIDYHIKAFNKLCMLLNGYVKTIMVSFIDYYQNVRNNLPFLKCQKFTDEDYKQIGENFSRIASQNNMVVQTCFEKHNLTEYGFIKGECLSKELAYKLTGKEYKKWSARKGNNCTCVELVDIGVYNSCHHLCKYCYANFDERKVEKNILMHNSDSPLLIGNLKSNDIVKERIK